MPLTEYRVKISIDGSGDGDNITNNRATWSALGEGIIIGIRLEYSGAASTADVTISEIRGLQRSFLTTTNNNTNTTYLQADLAYTASNSIDYLVDMQNVKAVVAQGGTSVTDAVTVIVVLYS